LKDTLLIAAAVVVMVWGLSYMIFSVISWRRYLRKENNDRNDDARMPPVTNNPMFSSMALREDSVDQYDRTDASSSEPTVSVRSRPVTVYSRPKGSAQATTGYDTVDNYVYDSVASGGAGQYEIPVSAPLRHLTQCIS